MQHAAVHMQHAAVRHGSSLLKRFGSCRTHMLHVQNALHTALTAQLLDVHLQMRSAEGHCATPVTTLWRDSAVMRRELKITDTASRDRQT